MSDATNVRVEARSGVAWITIDRAEKANALTIAMMEALSSRIRAAVADESVTAIVLTGAGRRAFSGGVDVRADFGGSPAEARALRSARFFELLRSLAAASKPVVVGLNGAASGGGAMLALLADRVIAAQDAALSVPEIDLGAPTFAGLAILEHAAGAGLAADLVLTARRMRAAEAHARGLVAEVVTSEGLAERTQQAAQMLAAKPAGAFALNKQWLRKPLLVALARAEEDTRRLRADTPCASLGGST